MKYLPFALGSDSDFVRPLLRFLLFFVDVSTGEFHSSNTSNASWRPGRGGVHCSLTSSVPFAFSGGSITFQSTRSPPGYVTMPDDRASPFSSSSCFAPLTLLSLPLALSCATLCAHDRSRTI